MIVDKNYYLSDSDIDCCLQSGAMKKYNIKNITFEDALVLSNAVPSKGFLRKNKNSIKTYVFSDETIGIYKIFRNHILLSGIQDESIKEVLVSVGKKFFFFVNI